MKDIIEKIKKNKKTLGITLAGILLIILIIVVISIFFAKKDLNEYKIKNENIYMYFGEEKFEFNSDVVLDNDNNVTSLKSNNKKLELYSEPVYIKNKKKVIFPKNMNVVFPKSSFKQYKVNYYNYPLLNHATISRFSYTIKTEAILLRSCCLSFFFERPFTNYRRAVRSRRRVRLLSVQRRNLFCNEIEQFHRIGNIDSTVTRQFAT